MISARSRRRLHASARQGLGGARGIGADGAGLWHDGLRRTGGRGGNGHRRGDHRPADLLPLDMDTIAASVKETGRCVIVHEATLTSGFGAELAALVQEACFFQLEAPIARVTGWDALSPCAGMGLLPGAGPGRADPCRNDGGLTWRAPDQDARRGRRHRRGGTRGVAREGRRPRARGRRSRGRHDRQGDCGNPLAGRWRSALARGGYRRRGGDRLASDPPQGGGGRHRPHRWGKPRRPPRRRRRPPRPSRRAAEARSASQAHDATLSRRALENPGPIVPRPPSTHAPRATSRSHRRRYASGRAVESTCGRCRARA